jgi:two-component system phosphate regulon response regulator OmpR
MNKFKAHILVVDDDDGIRSLVRRYLTENNFLVTTAKNAEDAAQKILIVQYDLIVLDIMMPGKNGLEFTREYRDKINTPIILLTAKSETNERVKGLEIGADDYLPKPFEPKELILRIINILNKTKKNNEKRILKFDNIKIDLNKLLIIQNNKEFKINNTEKIILEKMMNEPGKTFSREAIGKLIDLNKERSIDVIITRLRKKIEINPKNPKYLQTLRGVGYVLWIE